MGKISFSYTSSNSNRVVKSFQYINNDIIAEYSFSYDRYATIFNTSIFNNPVAINKVATGLYHLNYIFCNKYHKLLHKNINNIFVNHNKTNKIETYTNKQVKRILNFLLFDFNICKKNLANNILANNTIYTSYDTKQIYNSIIISPMFISTKDKIINNSIDINIFIKNKNVNSLKLYKTNILYRNILKMFTDNIYNTSTKDNIANKYDIMFLNYSRIMNINKKILGVKDKNGILNKNISSDIILKELNFYKNTSVHYQLFGKKDILMNIYNNLSLYLIDNILKIYKEEKVQNNDIYIKISCNKQNTFSERKELIFNILNNENAVKNFCNNLKIVDMCIGKNINNFNFRINDFSENVYSNSKCFNLFDLSKIFNCENKNSKLSLDDDIIVKIDRKEFKHFKNQINHCKKDKNKMNDIDEYLSSSKQSLKSFKHDHGSAYKDIKELFLSNEILSLDFYNKYLNTVDNGKTVYKGISNINYLNSFYSFNISNKKTIMNNILKSIFKGNHNTDIYRHTTTLSKNKINLNSNLTIDNIQLNKSKMNLMLNNKTIKFILNGKSTSLKKDVWSFKKRFYVFKNETNISLIKNAVNAFVCYDYFINNTSRDIVNHKQYFLYKKDKYFDNIIKNIIPCNVSSKKISNTFFNHYWNKCNTKDFYHIINHDIFLYKNNIDIVIKKDIFNLIKNSKSVSYLKHNTFLDRNNLNIDFLNSNDYNNLQVIKNKYSLEEFKTNKELAAKISNSIVIHDKLYEIFKTNKEFKFLDSLLTMYKQSDSFIIYNNMKSLSREKYKVPNNNEFQYVKKQVVSFILFNDNDTFKNILKNNKLSNVNNVIIPLSKKIKEVYSEKITSMIVDYTSTRSADKIIQKDVLCSVIPKNISINDATNMFIDKININSFIDYTNELISKKYFYASIITDKNIFLNKERKHAFSHNKDIYMSKYIKYITLTKYTDLFVNKKAIPAFDNYDEYLVYIKYHNSYLFDNKLFIETVPELCYYSYGYKNCSITNYNFNDISNDCSLYDNSDNSTNLFSSSFTGIIKNNNNAFYDNYIFTDSIINNCDIIQQIKTIHKINKKCDILPNDFGNWAWVYETQDPFKDNMFTIDELLIPEVDTRYENFEDIVFDKETLSPRNPVKEINETTFIAKFPIKHPIKKFNDIGLDYDKGAIKIDNYFGVEVDIMHTVFLRFYRIWQAKIFEFSTMTMQQSVNQILEYLFSWIIEYFPLEKQEQAFRVFKLIRWYGETAIIRNSQYIISYEYDTLYSKLTSGKCLIPNDLKDDNIPENHNETMFVDAKLGVIRNNPIFLNNDCSVSFFIDNKKNTTISFSLVNTVGSVNIYINDDLIDIQSKSSLNLIYEIPYTGDTNIIKIEKTSINNINNMFYIGNIKVANMSFKDLKIEFDPQLRAGNKPLNEIAMKIIQYANLREDRDKAYEECLKSNLGISEMYKKMLDYWNLHHQKKIKGKRLTIKQI